MDDFHFYLWVMESGALAFLFFLAHIFIRSTQSVHKTIHAPSTEVEKISTDTKVRGS